MKPTNRERGKFKPIQIGGNAARDTIRSRISIAEPGPGYMHFDARRDLGWYAQLIVERLTPKIVSGVRITIWSCPKGKANEAADCRVYAYAALQGLIHFGLRLNEAVLELATRWFAPTPATEAMSESWGDRSPDSWVGGGDGAWL